MISSAVFLCLMAEVTFNKVAVLQEFLKNSLFVEHARVTDSQIWTQSSTSRHSAW